MVAYYATMVKDVLNNLKNKMLENVEKLTRTIGAIRLSNVAVEEGRFWAKKVSNKMELKKDDIFANRLLEVLCSNSLVGLALLCSVTE